MFSTLTNVTVYLTSTSVPVTSKPASILPLVPGANLLGSILLKEEIKESTEKGKQKVKNWYSDLKRKYQ